MNLPNNTLLQGGKYRIVRFINSGGFGCTYEAEHVMLRQRVAIKEFFVKDFCNRDEATAHVTVGTQSKKGLVSKLRNKFIDEARSLFQLQHSGIVRVTDVFEENGTAYYVMDYVDGHSLSDIINHDGPLPEENALKYIRQVASALQYVHDHNRLHLDIKPGNIMVNAVGQAILIDFGASKQYDEESGENTSTLMGQTPGYAPTEQMCNDVITFTPATDIYALGATLYKLLSGMTPISASLRASGEDLAPLPSAISKETTKAVAAAMALNKKKRPQTIGEWLNLFTKQAADVTPSIEETIILQDSVAEPSFVESSQIETIEVNGVTFSMVGITGGFFVMGSPSDMKDARLDEMPSHKVALLDYSIADSVVTQALWKAVMHTNPSQQIGDDLPVENVSWEDCQEFLKRLNELTKMQFRLPTEAEWEYAARGGVNNSHFQFSGSNQLNLVGWYSANSDQKTHPIKLKTPNELGLYDMSGNTWEWCSDWWGKYTEEFQANPQGPSSGTHRVMRGGSWCSTERNCRVFNRCYNAPNEHSQYIGFRIAK